MAKCKTITFRPTPAALEALAELVKVHGDRSKAINAALVAASVLSENGLKLPKPIPAKPDTRPEITAGGPGSNTGHGHVWERPDGVKARCGGPGLCSECSKDAAKWPELWAAKAADKKPRSRRTKNKIERGLEEAVEYARRTKTNATIAPRPLPPEPELRANALRRRIPKPAWKADG